MDLHDSLHGFMERRGMGMATLEAKLDQQLACLNHDLLLQVL